ncbi:hypothetical protein AALP_AA7G104800 [Arabis alpina]|uniref:Uncharacterized protein n=1 Tax=Arabis alpina TaxID=50452 RepID=A0A087GH67_ARAAL|nr:hypothetical protein AALP_AA7G104800 [Arabis alpina]
MSARIVRVEGNKLWIRVKKEPAVEQAARGSPCSSKESQTATRHLSRVKEEAPADSPMEQDPHPRIFKMTPQPAEGAEVGLPGNPRVQRRVGIPIHRDWPEGFESEPWTPEVEPQSPRKGIWTEFHVALGGSTYHTAAHFADDAARLEKMGRDKEPGTFGRLGDTIPAPPTTAARVVQHDTRPANWSYFLDAYRTHADPRINPSPGEEARRGSNGWLEESDDESDIWSEVEPEWKRYWDSPPSATTPVGTQSG